MELQKLTINRDRTGNLGTFGAFIRAGEILAQTCELPWRNNRQKISCIPKGIYLVKRRYSPKFHDHFHILEQDESEVSGRDTVLMHKGNTIRDIQGCILPGLSRGELKMADGVILPAVLNSGDAMKMLLAELPTAFFLEIKGVCG